MELKLHTLLMRFCCFFCAFVLSLFFFFCRQKGSVLQYHPVRFAERCEDYAASAIWTLCRKSSLDHIGTIEKIVSCRETAQFNVGHAVWWAAPC